MERGCREEALEASAAAELVEGELAEDLEVEENVARLTAEHDRARRNRA